MKEDNLENEKAKDNIVLSDVIGSAVGHSVDGDDMHWTVDCPKCDKEYEFTGYYDSGDTFNCPICKHTFRTIKVWIDDAHYMQ